MAQKINVTLTDDLDPTTPADETVTFSIDGNAYEIDLSFANSEKLRMALEPWIGAARKTAGRSSGRRKISGGTTGSGMTKDELALVRAWANANGVQVSSRGRISAEVIAKFHSSQKKPQTKVQAAVERAAAKVAAQEVTFSDGSN